MVEIGRSILLTGVILAVLGALLMFTGRVGLPGDLSFRRGNFSFYLPLATSLVISILLTLLLNVFGRGR